MKKFEKATENNTIIKTNHEGESGVFFYFQIWYQTHFAVQKKVESLYGLINNSHFEVGGRIFYLIVCIICLKL